MSNETTKSAKDRAIAFRQSRSKEFWNGVKAVFKSAPEEQKKTDEAKLQAVVRKYFPEFWNNGSCQIQWNNNCYSYACNDPFGHSGKPQPGEKSGRTYGETTVESVTKASLKDGLLKAELDDKGNPISKKDYYLVALVVAEDWDYHWYRQDENGKWTHKMGSSLAKDVDNKGKKIEDPRFCDRGRYDQFGGFFYVPKNGLRIGEKAKRYKEATIDDDYKRHLERLNDESRKELAKIIQKCGIFTPPQKPANQNNAVIAKQAAAKTR